MIDKKRTTYDNLSEKKVDMKKKNKMFESDIGGESNV